MIHYENKEGRDKDYYVEYGKLKGAFQHGTFTHQCGGELSFIKNGDGYFRHKQGEKERYNCDDNPNDVVTGIIYIPNLQNNHNPALQQNNIIEDIWNASPWWLRIIEVGGIAISLVLLLKK
jgi:hypothetical protein